MRAAGFRAGLIDAAPILFGYMPVCLTFGAVGVGLGLDPTLVLGFSALLYAGASQFVAVQLLAAGVGGMVVVATTTLVNLRYALLARSLGHRIEATTLLGRAVVGPLLTEEVYAVAMYGHQERGESRSRRYILGLQVPPYVATMVFTAMGIGAGSIVPSGLLPPLTSALYALLIGLVLPRILADRTTAIICVIGAAVSAIATPIWGSTLAVIAVAIAALSSYEVLNRIRASARASSPKSAEQESG